MTSCRQSLNIEVAVDVESPGQGEQWLALADPNQLQQVLVNLSLNARDAMPKPQPVPVVYRLYHRVFVGEMPAFPQNVPAGDYLVVEVQDHGSGMPPEVMAQALDPFFTTKEVGEGTGLGLPVAFGIMHGHSGTLTVDTAVGKGTCIGLYFPRLLAPVPDVTAANVKVLAPESSPQRRDLDRRRRAGGAGRDLPLSADRRARNRVCRQRPGVLRHLQDGPVDLVVLDWMIPKEEASENFTLILRGQARLANLAVYGNGADRSGR